MSILNSSLIVKLSKFPEFLISSRKLVVGDPRDKDTFTGALISKEHLAKVKCYVDLAEKEGATIACGKEPLALPEKNKNVQSNLF